MTSVSNGSVNTRALQGTVMPENPEFCVPPPIQSHQTCFVTNQTMNLTYAVKELPQNPFNTCAVSMQDGLILWFPKRGTGEIYHMGIVPQGSYATRNQAQSFGTQCGIVIGSYSDNNTTFTDVNAQTPRDQFCGVMEFHFTKALALPRFDLQMALTPDLAEDFTLSRTFSGSIIGSCSSIGQLVANFNGLFSAAVFADSRDVAQNEKGNGCYTVQQMESFSAGVKENVTNVPLVKKIVMLQGADVEPEFSSPNYLNQIVLDGGWQFIQPPAVERSVIVNYNESAFYQVNLFNGWYSPWGVSMIDGMNGTQTPPQNMLFTQGLGNGSLQNYGVIDPLSEGGIVDCQFNICAWLQQQPIFTEIDSLRPFELISVVEHYFAGISDSANGIVSFNSLRTVHTVLVDPLNLQIDGPGRSVLGSHRNVGFGHRSSIQDQYIQAGGMSKIGKFIGCRVYACAYISTVQQKQATNFSISVSGNGPFLYTQGNSSVQTNCDEATKIGPNVSFFSRDANLHDAIGPVHVTRYDQVGPSQQMVWEGYSNAQVVAKAAVMKYTKSQISEGIHSTDSDFYPMLNAMYNGRTPYRMVFSGDQYDEFVFTQAGPFTADHIGRIQQNDANAGVALHNTEIDEDASPGASLFSSSVRRDRDEGTQGASFGTGMGAAGQFGSLRAHGQFGARGQFGASGQFPDCDDNLSKLRRR